MPEPALGVIFHPRFPPESLPEFARRAESGGFDELWLWDDCFLPGAFTSAAIALSATKKLKVGIGLLPATAYNPLFAAMEITTLSRAFPRRFMPGFGHGVGSWMKQIGAAPESSLQNLAETVVSVRKLLDGEMVTTHVDRVNLERVQMQVMPAEIPQLYVGAMRARSLQLAGRVGDGTILTGMSSPEYIRWAREQIQAGMGQASRSHHRLVVYLDVKVNPDGSKARAAVRRSLANRWPWAGVQTDAAGLTQEIEAFVQAHGVDGLAQEMPEKWLDAFAAAGTPEQVMEGIQSRRAAGAASLVFQPLDGDPDCLDEYLRYLMPYLDNFL